MALIYEGSDDCPVSWNSQGNESCWILFSWHLIFLMVQVETIYLLNQKKQAMNSILFSFTFSAGFYVALVLSIDKAKEYRELDFGKNS
jgi:hypothetical protein